MTRFVPVDRETQYLFPPSVQEWLPDDHLARFIVDVIEQLDWSELEQSYAGRGSDAHHPAMLVALLVQGYAQVMGMLKLGTVSLDGTKVHANASRHKAMSYGYAKKRQAQLKAEVTALLKRAEAANARDLPEGLNIPEELARREQRLAA